MIHHFGRDFKPLAGFQRAESLRCILCLLVELTILGRSDLLIVREGGVDQVTSALA